MEIKIEPLKQKKIVNTYIVKVKTMEGLGDNYHEMVFNIKDAEKDHNKFNELLTILEILKIIPVKYYSSYSKFNDISYNLYYSENYDEYDSIEEINVYY